MIGDIRGKGLFLGIEFVQDPQTRARFDPPLGQRIGQQALRNGLLTRFDPHWMAFGPPLTINEEEVDQIAAILERSIVQVLEEG